MILKASEDELWALCVWREARGESDLAKLGVAYTIENRTRDVNGRWPRTPRGVILQPWQFSSFNANDPNAKKFPREDDKSWAASKAAVEAVKAGVEDPTRGANHYHSIPDGKPWPKWARPTAETAHLDAFRFYRL